MAVFVGQATLRNWTAGLTIRTKDNGGTVVLEDIPASTAVLIDDANCLVYAFTAEPLYWPACRSLLERIENQEQFGSPYVLPVTKHR